MVSGSVQTDLRPVQPQDASTLLELWNRSAEFDPLRAELLHEKVWGDADFQPHLALISQDLKGFVMGLERPTGRGYIKFLLVAPERRRQGLGRRLLEAVEARLPSPVLRVCETPPNYLVPGVDVRYTAGLLMLERLGYQKLGETFNLVCDLRATLRPPDRGGIRRAREADYEPVMSFLRKHFAAWQAEVARTFANQPISLHLGWEGDRLLGFAGYDGNNLGTGWFGPMGTDPEVRSRGLGGILLLHCLRDLHEQGLEQAIIPWVGPYGFYSHHCGARIDRVFWRYEKCR
jgi:ribosomal protein S18 acetylase RimI-like enzyme